MTLTFDLIQTMGIAALVYMLGSFIKKKVPFLQKYFIPAPVIGGILCSLLIFVGEQNAWYTVNLTTTLQDFLMNIFFTCTGFTCSAAIIKKSGKQGAILAVGAVLFLAVQNLVGIGLAGAFGLNKLLGIAMGSISMSGGVGSGAAFGPMLESLGADGGTTVGVAAATFGLLMGSIVGGPIAERLIKKNDLKCCNTQIKADMISEVKTGLDGKHIFASCLVVLLAAAAGSIISYLLNLTGLKFPYYVGCLFAGMLFRNLSDAKLFALEMPEIDMIGNVSLNGFLSLALMSLNISKR
jgi:glutamate:Na+ symporter, ESS family